MEHISTMYQPFINHIHSGYVKIAIETVDLPIDNMVIFLCYVNVYQRVSHGKDLIYA